MLIVCDSVKYKEKDTGYWKDTGCTAIDSQIYDKKQSTIDLTVNGGAALDNDGSHTMGDSGAESRIQPISLLSKSTVRPIVEKKQTGQVVPPTKKQTFPLRPRGKIDHQPPSLMSHSAGLEDSIFTSTFPTLDTQSVGTQPVKRTVTFIEPIVIIPTSSADANAPSPSSGIDDVPSATHGRGGTATSRRGDFEALLGRMGRKETCVINAAIMASSWPHKDSGGKKYNKPIVVDIDLPVWADSAPGNHQEICR